MARAAVKVDRETLLLLAAEWFLFAGNAGVYLQSRGTTAALPLWLHVGVGTVAIHLAFTIWHEAAHGNVSNRKWINDVTGVLGMIPYTTPYFFQRFAHLNHHKYLNLASQDPNQIYADGPFWQLPFRYVRGITYARNMVKDDPRSPGMRTSDAVFLVLVFGSWLLALLLGEWKALLVLWIGPLVIAKVIMDWYVNYLPHVGLPPDRFLGTRILDVPWLTPLLLKHNFHAIHHLWPSIPWHRYPESYLEKYDYLVAHGVPIERRLIGGRIFPGAAGAGDRAS